MSDTGQTFWEKFYQGGQKPWDIGEAAPPLSRWFNLNTPQGKSVLVPGCGHGHEARMLIWKNANPVVAMDFVPQALEQAKAIESNISRQVQWVLGDVLKIPTGIGEPFDLVVEHTCFAALDPYSRNNYLRGIKECLKPDGRFVGLFFVDFQTLTGPPFGIFQRDLRSLLATYFDIQNWESHPADSHKKRAGYEALVVARARG